MFVTAHFHYTLMGAGLTGAIGALAYWFPKMTGRMLDARRRVRVVLAGPDRLQRHVPRDVRRRPGGPAAPGRALRRLFGDGQPGLDDRRLRHRHWACWSCSTPWSSSWRHGPVAPTNPWGAKTLEWTVPNPIPLANFEVLPVVIADPYGFGEGDVPLFLPLPRTGRRARRRSAPATDKEPALTGPDAPHVTDREQP